MRIYETYSPELLDKVEFVIVDDGSPIAYEVPKFNLNLRWLKINEDIRWNQSGARNLGFTYARSDKVLVTDLDHIFYENTLSHLANNKFSPHYIYKHRRTHIHRNGFKERNYLGAGNIFFMSRAVFLKYFGYDEEFAGNYGCEDNFCDKYFSKKKFFYRERDNSDVNREKSYHSLIRDADLNSKIYEKKIQKMDEFGPEYAHSRLFLNFTWRIISDQRRKTKPKIKKRNLFKKLFG